MPIQTYIQTYSGLVLIFVNTGWIDGLLPGGTG